MDSQDTAISFSFTAEEAEIIRTALGKMPHDDVQLIVVKMYQTVHDHVFGSDEDPPPAIKRSVTKKSRLRRSLERKPKKSRLAMTPQEKSAEAPYGLKKNGTPKKRPGRAPKEQA